MNLFCDIIYTKSYKWSSPDNKKQKKKKERKKKISFVVTCSVFLVLLWNVAFRNLGECAH